MNTTHSSTPFNEDPGATQEKKPPYWLALFCLIPALGFLAGILILILGLIKYKGKLFPILGGLGIVLNLVFCFAFAFHFIKQWQPFREGFSTVSKMQLNTLVKDIEFYKVKKGQYPDSLAQLTSTDKMVNTTDPLQITRGHDKAVYNYKKLGEKYTVFSSGPDGIPGTRDDIYPTIEVGDSSKVGFIREVPAAK